MCTLLTVSKEFWTEHSSKVSARMTQDSISNSDGISVLILSSRPDEDVSFSGMDAMGLLPLVQAAMDSAAPGSRLFVHQRMATTEYVGIAFNHGFTDFRGTVLMHNGIVSNPKNFCVDSYNLLTLPADPEESVLKLIDEKETYANVFRIHTHDDKWDVLRLSTGSLYTDGFGNYSTNACGPIDVAVERYSAQTYFLPGRTENRPKLYTWKGYQGNQEHYWKGYHFDSVGDEFIESFPWELDDKEELLAQGEHVFVTYDDSQGKLFAYLMSDGSYYYKEKAYRDGDLPASLKTLKTQAEYIVEECEREIIPMRKNNAG